VVSALVRGASVGLFMWATRRLTPDLSLRRRG
jgi:hypothetical protein